MRPRQGRRNASSPSVLEPPERDVGLEAMEGGSVMFLRSLWIPICEDIQGVYMRKVSRDSCAAITLGSRHHDLKLLGLPAFIVFSEGHRSEPKQSICSEAFSLKYLTTSRPTPFIFQ